MESSAPNDAANDTESLVWSAQGDAVRDISTTLNALLADLFTLYLKTKSFHWHVTGAHFRDYHLLFDEQAGELIAATDAVAERVRKVGTTTIHSVAHVMSLARLRGNDADGVHPTSMLAELHSDNMRLAEYLREAHLICADYEDVGSKSVLDSLVDEAEKRSWVLSELTRACMGAP